MRSEISRRVFTVLYPIRRDRDKKSKTNRAMITAVFFNKKTDAQTNDVTVRRIINAAITAKLLGARKKNVNILPARRTKESATVNFFSLKVAMLSIIIG